MVTQVRTNLTGHARLRQVVFDRGFLEGADLWWLQPHGLLFVVPAKENIAVTIDAQAQAAAGEDVTVGRSVHAVRHGQGKTAWTERLEIGVLWHLSHGGRLAAAGGQHQRSATGDRYTGANLGQLWAHNTWLSFYPNFR
jgi:hypothetical protein